ncbi:hypothetical protein E3T33_08480 [Cryobacterium sp. TMT1-2-1]|uniref:hypothetical protein n=1 Tax=Cryobacterium sp. TMT1-2-1 TaxID=1259232 RepID=UPI00106C207B|nr:hypothetical protein [Cryobacterium sp. TMT1-2-1]TFD44684.1 hypothetical protein E3T33_08480 [Cryobacterium sp. TMT1-2-1]
MLRWTLGLGAAVLLVGAPMLAAALNGAGPTMQPLAALVRGYFLTGDYPALIFLPFLLVGLIADRSDLGRAKTQFWMIAGGVLAAVLGYGAAYVLPGLTARAHSGSTAEILGSGGFALAVIVLGKGPLERGLAFATREPVSRAKARARARSHDAAPEPKIQNR